MFIEELSIASQYIAEDHGSTMETLASLSQHDEITFDLLWALFPPNATVYTKSNLLCEEQILRLQKGEYGTRSNGSRYFSLDLRLISHDGEKLGWAESNIQIEQFDGAKKVRNLLCFPLDRHPEKETIHERLMQRGKRYLELMQATYQEYTGAAVTENRDVIVNDEYKKVVIHVSQPSLSFRGISWLTFMAGLWSHYA